MSQGLRGAYPLRVALGPGQGGWAQNDGGEKGRGQVVQRALCLGCLLTGALDPPVLGESPRLCPVVRTVPGDL